MSTFPTAFWKTDAAPAAAEVDFTIEWTTSLAQSYGDNKGNVGAGIPSTPAEDYFFPTGNSYNLANHNFPFKVYDVNYESYEDFYSSYGDVVWQGDPSYEPDGNGVSSTPYFGWYRNGGIDSQSNIYNLSPDFHRSDPWIVNGFDRPNELHIFFESDNTTALVVTGSDGVDEWDDTEGFFNNFIQSGEAMGTFNISSAQVGKHLVVEVSGLGEDGEYFSAAQNYDVMSLYLDRPDVASDEFICSGSAPMDGRNVLGLNDAAGLNFDLQQVKLYTGSNIYSPANADPANETAQDPTVSPVGWSQLGNEGNVETKTHGAGSEREWGEAGSWGEYLVSGVPRANPTQRVNQNTRNDHGAYVTSAGVGTFTATNLQLGEHKIKISASSVDATFTSGAFYGFHFKLVD